LRRAMGFSPNLFFLIARPQTMGREGPREEHA
jgi:hypothetical protein